MMDDLHCTTFLKRERMILGRAVPSRTSGYFRSHYVEEYARSINGRKYSSASNNVSNENVRLNKISDSVQKIIS